jgi:uncharacterized protein (DUF2132 family)
MTDQQLNNPLHGITLEMMLRDMVERFGWEGLARDMKSRCFSIDPSIKSALNFLRKTPWARRKFEELYLISIAPDTRAHRGGRRTPT